MAEEIALENGRISNFQARARDLDLGSGHTAYRRASLIDHYLQSYMPNFIEIEETSCGRTYVCTHIRTDGRTFKTGFARSTMSKSQS